MNKTIVITGPTASGKSYVLEELVWKKDLVIINADSRQVYREIPLITSQPYELFSYHKLYGYIGAQDHYSVAIWLQHVEQELSIAAKKNLIPVIVGGTGMYINALLCGLAVMPEINTEVREHFKQIHREYGCAKLYSLLQQRDGYAAQKIGKSDTYRLLRALEVVTQTNKSILEWQKNKPLFVLKDYTLLALIPVREQIYCNIKTRFGTMLKHGAIAEVYRLLQNTCNRELNIFKTCGVSELIAYLQGEISLQTAILLTQISTCRYAKRQLTWLKKYCKLACIFDNTHDLFSHLLNVLCY